MHTGIHVTANRQFEPDARVVEGESDPYVALYFDRRLVTLTCSVEQARTLHSVLGAMLFDHETTSREQAMADGAEAWREERIWRERDAF